MGHINAETQRKKQSSQSCLIDSYSSFPKKMLRLCVYNLKYILQVIIINKIYKTNRNSVSLRLIKKIV